jgi:hypothetical protein
MEVRLSPPERQEIEDLLTEFFWRLDHGQAGQVPELFLPQGQLDMGDRPAVQGRAALQELFNSRPVGLVTRHTWSSLKLQSSKPTRVEASFISVAYVQINPPEVKIAISDVMTEFEWEGSQRWRIAAMQLSTVLLVETRAS